MSKTTPENKLTNAVIDINPLSVNACWQGRRFKTKAYKDYEKELLLRLPSIEAPEGLLELHIKFYFKNYKMRDVDNPAKPILDILKKKGWIKDDRFVYRLILDKIPSKKNGVEIILKQYKGAEK